MNPINRNLSFIAFILGLAAVTWVAVGYVGVVFRRMKLNLPPPRKMLRKKKEAAAEAPAAESPEVEEEA